MTFPEARHGKRIDSRGPVVVLAAIKPAMRARFFVRRTRGFATPLRVAIQPPPAPSRPPTSLRLHAVWMRAAFFGVQRLGSYASAKRRARAPTSARARSLSALVHRPRSTTWVPLTQTSVTR
jgi:hypothetical protein